MRVLKYNFTNPEFVLNRLLGFNLIAAYHRAKFSAIKIIGRKITVVSNSNNNNHHYNSAQSADSQIAIPGTSGIKSAKSRKLQEEKVEVHQPNHHCSTEFSDDDDCYDYGEQQPNKTEYPLRSLSESIPNQHLCSSITCENQSCSTDKL